MEKPAIFEGGKSLCTCGHLGDGIPSAHTGFQGHGECTIRGCECLKFTWARFTKRYLRWCKITQAWERA